MKLLKKFLLVFVVLTISVLVYCFYVQKCINNIGLSVTEKEWLKENKTKLSFTFDPLYPPIDLVNKYGDHDGIASDYIEIIAQKLGLEFKEIVSKTWSEALADVGGKKINFLAAAHKTPQRSEYLDFTVPYVEVPLAIVARHSDRSIYNLDTLKNYKVGAARSHAVVDMLANTVPDLDLHEVDGNLHGLLAVQNGTLDAFVIDSVSATFLIQEHDISDLRIASKTSLSYKLSIALSKGQKILQSIFNKAIRSVTKKEMARIEEKWNYYNTITYDSKYARLSNEQSQWLDAHKDDIVLAPDAEFRPIEFFDEDKKFSGIAADYAKIIENKLGIKFKHKYIENWKDNLIAAQNREIDVWSAVSPSAIKKSYMAFTQPYLKLKTVVLVSDEQLRKLSLDNVRNENVLVVDGYYTHDYLKRYYPDINVIPVENVAEGLRRVAFKENDAFVCDLVTAVHTMEQEGLTNLKIASEVNLDYELAFAVRKDWLIFRDILDQILKEISPKERQQIYRAWVSSNGHLFGSSRMLKKVILSLLIILLVAILAIVSNLMLRRVLRQQKKKLIKSQNDLLIFKLMNDTAVHGILYADYDGTILYSNKNFAKMHGLDFDDVIGKHVSIFHNEKQLPDLKNLIAEVKEKGGLSNREIWHVRADGSEFPTLMNFKVFDLDGKRYVSAVAVDISNEKRAQELIMQNEKMMSLGGLAAGMAHEINNPLGAVLQTLQNIQRRIDSNVPKNIETAKKYNLDLAAMSSYLEEREIYKFIDGARSSGERAAKLIETMLQFAGNKSDVKQREDIAVLLDKAIELAMHDYDLKSKYDFKHVKIRKEYCLGEYYSEVVGVEIEQVFFNMLKNAAHAFRAIDQAERINLIIIRMCSLEGKLRIEIEDNGPGIPDEKIKKIFDPFYTSKAPGVGTGLGLSIAYFIITENHNGTLSVESQLGQGTKFIIELSESV